MEINIDGVVDGPENPDAFFHEFIQWIESKGYIFGGGIGQYKDEMDLFVPAPAILKESTPSKRKFHVCGVTCEPHRAECNNYCNMKTVNGKKFVGPMPDSPTEFEESTSSTEQESQEELWAKVISDARHYNGTPHNLTALTDHFKKQFTITRKP